MAFFYISEDTTALASAGEELMVLVAGGELDHHASPSLREQIAGHIDAGKRRLVLDLSAVTFIDSTAIGVLVGAAVRLQETKGGTVAVVCGPDNERVLRIFDIAGVDNVITLCSSREDALLALAG
jgi:anti-sigma B factor antagonist